ncbi:hypothetical protein BT69DRAFT_1044836 [Atractiella rhizophila]|nr:hypothetical protein BT69DRAFT_1044836 [Atractiella rhizophila]
MSVMFPGAFPSASAPPSPLTVLYYSHSSTTRRLVSVLTKNIPADLSVEVKTVDILDGFDLDDLLDEATPRWIVWMIPSYKAEDGGGGGKGREVERWAEDMKYVVSLWSR